MRGLRIAVGHVHLDGADVRGGARHDAGLGYPSAILQLAGNGLGRHLAGELGLEHLIDISLNDLGTQHGATQTGLGTGYLGSSSLGVHPLDLIQGRLVGQLEGIDILLAQLVTGSAVLGQGDLDPLLADHALGHSGAADHFVRHGLMVFGDLVRLDLGHLVGQLGSRLALDGRGALGSLRGDRCMGSAGRFLSNLLRLVDGPCGLDHSLTARLVDRLHGLLHHLLSGLTLGEPRFHLFDKGGVYFHHIRGLFAEHQIGLLGHGLHFRYGLRQLLYRCHRFGSRLLALHGMTGLLGQGIVPSALAGRHRIAAYPHPMLCQHGIAQPLFHNGHGVRDGRWVVRVEQHIAHEEGRIMVAGLLHVLQIGLAGQGAGLLDGLWRITQRPQLVDDGVRPLLAVFGVVQVRQGLAAFVLEGEHVAHVEQRHAKLAILANVGWPLLGSLCQIIEHRTELLQLGQGVGSNGQALLAALGLHLLNLLEQCLCVIEHLAIRQAKAGDDLLVVRQDAGEQLVEHGVFLDPAGLALVDDALKHGADLLGQRHPEGVVEQGRVTVVHRPTGTRLGKDFVEAV